MIEVPEYILWDGSTTNIEKWGDTTHNHFWFSLERSKVVMGLVMLEGPFLKPILVEFLLKHWL
jgi:hypothetical protein